MANVVGDLLPLSLAVSLNPIAIIAVLLTVQSGKSRTSGLGFMAGWVIGISGIVAGVVALSSLLPDEGPDASSPVVGIVLVGLGLLLVYLAWATWRKRPNGDAEEELPGWMRTMSSMSAGRSFGMALMFSVLNFKHIIIAMSAASLLVEADLGQSDEFVAVVVFIVLCTWPVIALVLAHGRLGPTYDARLADLHGWLVANNATVMSVVLLVIGWMVLGDGFASF